MDISPADPFDIDIRVVTPTEDAAMGALTVVTCSLCVPISVIVCPNG